MPDSAPTLTSDQIGGVMSQVKPFTMVPPSAVAFTMEQALRVIAAGIPGVMVECGTWRGGCAMAILLAQRLAFGEVRRPVYLFDSFEGLPPARETDGPLALAWQRDVASPAYFDNCRAELTVVVDGLAALGFREGDYQIVKGWFSETLPKTRARLESLGISLLRLDGDWYESTTQCLESLVPLVAPEGTVIIDDYFAWDGCARAVHDYLSRRDEPYRIRSLEHFYGAYFIKRPLRNSLDVL